MSHMQCRITIVATVCLLCAGALSQDLPPYPDGPLEFLLNPVENGFSVFSFGAEPDTEIVFKKEPEYSGDNVYRNAIRLGGSASDFIGLACDMDAGMLYIDRNRNLDLTDDGPGLKTTDLYGIDYARFTNVRLEQLHDTIPVQYTLDVYVYSGGSYSLVRSGWMGDIEIAGIPCTLGIADNLDGTWGSGDEFRFDRERNWEARLSCGKEDSLSLPKWLWLEGHLYCMESDFRLMDGYTALAVSLTPVTENLMDIAFEGQFVSRVMMTNESREWVLLDWPQAAMRIQAGNYNVQRIDLLDSFSGYPRYEREITAQHNVLKTGGPVKQTVTASREGVNLNLNYALKGADQTDYSPDMLSREARARFEIYLGERCVRTGQFEYG